MMNTSLSFQKNIRTVITDIAVLVLVYFLPALTHLTPFPLYYLDPMRLLLFAAYIISRNSANAYILAATIPLFSSLVAHHPPFYKALLISVELLVNITAFEWLVKKVKWQPGTLFFIAAVISKLFYYGFKYLFISWGLIEGALITTGLDIQLYTIAGLAILFAFFYKRKAA